jgi:hypothetical protein
MKWLIISLFILYCSNNLWGQDIEVKKFEPMAKDQTAALSPRKDINGTVCGLVKVALKEPGAEFEGNVMGDVQFTGNEYLVYLPNGTKRLGIKHPDYLPTTIVFADYGTKKIASSTTYELKVKTNKKQAKVDNSKKGMAVFNIKPSNAMLLIDGQIADGSGGAYTLSLPYGTHYYTVKLKDFSINNQSVQIDKNAKNINVDLTEFFAKVNVSCKTGDASVLLNSEQKGFGNWKGIVIPGKCTVEVKKEGYHTLSKSFELMDGDSVNVDFAALKAITGSLRVENELKDCEVFLNGEKVGTTPWVNKNLPIGEYNVEIRHKYYTPLKRSVVINEDQELVLKEKLSQHQIDKLLMCADNGDPKAYCLLAELYLYGTDYVRQNEGWGKLWDNNDNPIFVIDRNKYLEEGVYIDKNVEKAAFWLKKVAEEDETKIDFFTGIDDIALMLMTHYLLGEGVEQNFNQSFYWAEISFRRQTITSRYWVAWHYYYGKGVGKNTEKTLSLLNDLRYLESNDNGSYKTCNRDLLARLFKKLGYLMFMGDGVPKYEERLQKFIETY